MDDRMDPSVESEFRDDPVDWFATEIVKHPERAEVLKRGLRERLEQPKTPVRAVEAEDTSDPDDLWDNVPI